MNKKRITKGENSWRRQVRPGAARGPRKPLLAELQRVWAVALLIVFSAPTILVLFASMPALALDVQSQSDWSGGVGTDPTNQYTTASGLDTATPGHLTVDTSSANWCSDTNCSASWSRRQAVRVQNYQNGAYTNKSVKLYVPYDSDMQTDFDDIRFADDSGNDLDYYLHTKTNSAEAEFVISLPSIAGFGVTTFYMYYGNGAASSASTDSMLTITDDLDTEPLSGQWSNPGGTLSGGVVSMTGQASFSSTATEDRSVDRTYELDISSQISATSCETSNYPFSIYTTSTLALNFYHAACDGDGSYYSPTSIYDSLSEEDHNISNPHSIHDETFRIRYTAYAAGGTDFYYSTDNGRSYTKYDASSFNETDNSMFKIETYGQSPTATIANPISYVSAPVSLAPGVEEFQGGKVGVLLSVTHDFGHDNTSFGSITVASTGTGNIKIFPVSSNSSSLQLDPRFCPSINSGDALTDSSCVTDRKQYVTYYAEFATDSAGSLDVTNISFEYTADVTGPTNATNLVMKQSSSGATIDENDWVNTAQPYFSWTAGSDNAGGSGLAGYCLYFGTESNGDPASSQGVIDGSSPLDTDGACAYAVTTTNFNGSADAIDALTGGETYYMRIRAIDNFGNLSSTTLSSHMRFDSEAPSSATLYTLPTAVNSKVVRASWLTTASVSDNHSGVAGYKYCVTTMISGFSGCSPSDQNWYGAAHTSGSISDTSDVVPFSAGEVSTVPADFSRLDDAVAGVNALTMVLVDNAGNYVTVGTGIFIITYIASDAPTNLAVSPSSNTSNSFSFTWDQPTNLVGGPSQANYCWTVNVEIEADQSNCTWTGAGITQLAAGPYATRQGSNTFYIATKDVTGNFDNSKVASVNFTATTTAPGIPQDLELADVSIRATSTWKLAVSWSAPSSVGSGVANYRILRSTDNSTFTEVGSTSAGNTSFIDSGLSQVDYYYKVKACDSAGSCSPPTAATTRKPTGRFTEPARLTAETDQPKERDVTTRSAVVYWFTDRDSDSRVAIGTSPGVYVSQEIGNSTQTGNHNVNLTNLEPGTRYYYVARWTDEDGNTGQSAEHSFTTLPAPSFSDVTPINLTINSATIRFTSTNASSVKLFYGKTEAFGAVQTIDTSTDESSYSLDLAELEDGTKYFFKLNGSDPEGNEYQGDIYSFTTPARPRITELTVNTVEGEASSTKLISWKTNVPATSLVTYRTATGAPRDAAETALTTDHKVTIRGLEDSSDYTLTATSRDAAGNTAVSDARTFRTSEDTRPPKIKDVTIETSIRGNGSEARGQIIVSWETDEPSTSQVAFGQGEKGKLSNRTAKDDRLSLEHTVVVSDVPTSSIFQVQVVANDKAGNSALSEPQTAIIGRASENVFSLIFTALQQIFGIGN